MLLFPALSRTTLDSFHRDVYRPRLALLLLLVLLIVGDRERRTIFGTAKSNVGKIEVFSEQETLRSSSKNVVQGSDYDIFRLSKSRLNDKHALTLRGRVDTLFRLLAKRVRLLDESATAQQTDTRKRRGHDSANTARRISKGTHTEVLHSNARVKLDRKEVVGRTTQKEQTSRSRQRRKASKEHQSNNARSTVVDVQRSFIARALDVDVLSVFVSLHALWLIRLGSMLLEDRIGKEAFASSSTTQSKRTSFFAFSWFTTSALLAVFACLFGWSDMLHRWGFVKAEEGGHPATLVVAIITQLELFVTLVSLACPLTKLEGSIFASTVSLPSPSHSPSLLELLPLPAGLIQSFNLRESPPPGLRGRRRMANRSLVPAPVAPPFRHGDLTGAGATFAMAQRTERQADRLETRQAFETLQSSAFMAEPLRLPTPGKAPRLQGIRVRVETSWLLENAVVLLGHVVGVLQYVILLFSLPTLAATSFPVLLSLFSLRAEIAAVVYTWSSARRSIECLEFVRRRWATMPSVQPSQDEDVCSICFEQVSSNCSVEDRCTLDCGHQLHSICLVQWLTKQAFCPCCHAALKATPPNGSNISSDQQ